MAIVTEVIEGQEENIPALDTSEPEVIPPVPVAPSVDPVEPVAPAPVVHEKSENGELIQDRDKEITLKNPNFPGNGSVALYVSGGWDEDGRPVKTEVSLEIKMGIVSVPMNEPTSLEIRNQLTREGWIDLTKYDPVYAPPPPAKTVRVPVAWSFLHPVHSADEPLNGMIAGYRPDGSEFSVEMVDSVVRTEDGGIAQRLYADGWTEMKVETEERQAVN